jgi:hypothetical protein
MAITWNQAALVALVAILVYCVSKAESNKLLISIVSGILFFAISNPLMYRLTNAAGSAAGISLADRSGCPTVQGLAVHSVVFTAVVYISMII